MSDEEAKLVYQDGSKVSALRGVIEAEDDLFVYLKRRDGDYRIAKRAILKIEEKRERDGAGM